MIPGDLKFDSIIQIIIALIRQHLFIIQLFITPFDKFHDRSPLGLTALFKNQAMNVP